LLAAIALLPLVAPRWWHPNHNQALLAVVVSLPVLWQLGIALGEPGWAVLVEKLHDYVGFIVVIGALFVIAGGIHVQGSLSGTPLVNTGMLGLGAVLANLLGTTGASVLLIRPLVRANKSRRRGAHIVVFFIFLVANCGGRLTPMGDPPLLLGFLKGVPFEWTLRLWPQWLTATGALLVIFNLWDQWALNREERERPGSQLERVMVHEPLRVNGAASVAALGGVVLTIIAAVRGGTPLRVLLDDGGTVERARQRPHLSRVRSQRGRPRRHAGARAVHRRARPPSRHRTPARRDLHRSGVHGREHLHRERAQLHGQGDRRGERHQDAFVLRLHGLQLRDSTAAVRGDHLAVLLVIDHFRRGNRNGECFTTPSGTVSPCRSVTTA